MNNKRARYANRYASPRFARQQITRGIPRDTFIRAYSGCHVNVVTNRCSAVGRFQVLDECLAA
jgi:hypothetical protein